MQQKRLVEEKYEVCDFCGEEFPKGFQTTDENVYVFSGDFPDVIFHKEPCLRRAAVLGARTKNPIPN